ncbi:MAG: hypothetical protein IT521_01765 [Burkholderiales bacterium]|nr:hypothetical protein [Burkholderiales bacterium]
MQDAVADRTPSLTAMSSRSVAPLARRLLLTLALLTGPASAADVQELLQKYRCTICHAEREVLAGPPWVDIAARYRGQPQAEMIISTRIRAGARGSGLWHMPPHPEVPKTEAALMSRYILTFTE